MRKFLLFMIPVVVIGLAGCSFFKSPETTSQALDDSENVITWGKVDLLDKPGENGQVVTTAVLGDHFEVDGDVVSEMVDGKSVDYRKIKLSDGKSGWVREDYIATGVYAAAILEETPVFSKPDSTAHTDLSFLCADFIVVRKIEGDYLEVRGTTYNSNGYIMGYVASSDVSYDSLDIRFATLITRASTEEDKNVADQLREQSNDETVFMESAVWMNYHSRIYPQEEEEEELYIEEDSVSENSENDH